MKVVLEDLSGVVDYENGLDCAGGYGIPGEDEIHIDSNLSYERMRLVTIHEVLDYYLWDKVKHPKIDKIAIEIIDALMQVGVFNDRQLPDNPHMEIEGV